jgi:hypothetical protein
MAIKMVQHIKYFCLINQTNLKLNIYYLVRSSGSNKVFKIVLIRRIIIMSDW